MVSNALLFYLGRARASGSGIWFNSFVQFECFAAGILCCLVLHERMPRFTHWQRAALLTCSWSCWFFASYELHYGFVHASENPGSWPLIGGYALGALGSVLLLIAFLGAEPKLLPGWAIYLGRISFGLYVYHQFAINTVDRMRIDRLLFNAALNYPLRVFLNSGLTLGLPLGLTFLAAALSYRYLETPFLRMKKRHAVIESQPVSAL